jgi:hypothetical protein
MSSSSFFNLGVTSTANINNLNVTTVTGSSITANNAIVTSFTATNLTATNIFGSSVTATNLSATNLTASNVTVPNLTTTADATINGNKVGKGPGNVTNNLAIGDSALRVSTGNLNLAIGNAALFNNTSGVYNLAIGVNSLYTNTVGNNNTAIGVQTLFRTIGSKNIAIGTNTYWSESSGSNNTVIGHFAAGSLSSGSNNTVIGANAGLGLSTHNNCIAIGYNSSITLPVDNQIILGTSAQTIYIQGGLNYYAFNLPGTATPSTPMVQFYTIKNGGTDATITLMQPSVSTNGKYVAFRRGIGSTGTITFNSCQNGTTTALNVMVGTNSIATATSLAYGSTVYNFQFIATTGNWYQII